MQNLLEIKDLTVRFDTDEGRLTAVDGVSLSVRKNEVLGLVGESGCGKSVTAMSATRLIPSPPGRIEQGQVLFDGMDLLQQSNTVLRTIRGKRISMIFQDPMTALSPLHRVGGQLAETILIHEKTSKKQAWERGIEWLAKVGIPSPAEAAMAYPFELSGGMQQRVMIAMALLLSPELVIADEPTTALDVTISAQIFDLLRAMRSEKTSVLLITHDLGVVWELCDRVAVMYAGKMVEKATARDLFNRPGHPYTQGLLSSVPVLGDHERELFAIPGQVPSPMNFPRGCRFSDRCQYAQDPCRKKEPRFLEYEGGRRAACFLAHQWIGKPIQSPLRPDSMEKETTSS